MTDRPRYRFTKDQKLRRPVEFKRVYDGGAKAGDDRLLVFALPNDLGATRLGLSVSKKHGGAVKRNRIKRLLREAFRLGQHELPAGYDLILIPRPDTASTLAEYRKSLAGCARRAVKRLPPAGKGIGGGEGSGDGADKDRRTNIERQTGTENSLNSHPSTLNPSSPPPPVPPSPPQEAPT